MISGVVHTTIEIFSFCWLEQALFLNQPLTPDERFFCIFIIWRVIAAGHIATLFILIPCGKHETIVFTVRSGQDDIPILRQFPVIMDAIRLHLWGCFIETHILTNGSGLLLELLTNISEIVRLKLIPAKSEESIRLLTAEREMSLKNMQQTILGMIGSGAIQHRQAA